MKITLNNDADVCGTSRVGEITASYAALEAAFGEPIESDGYKVSGEWSFETDEGDVFTLYDWKSTKLYDGEYPSVEEFRSLPNAEFNIGGRRGADIAYFKEWLLSQIS